MLNRDIGERGFRCRVGTVEFGVEWTQIRVRLQTQGALHDVLTGEDQSEEFAHLSLEDRQAILEILTETKPDLWDE